MLKYITNRHFAVNGNKPKLRHTDFRFAGLSEYFVRRKPREERWKRTVLHVTYALLPRHSVFTIITQIH